MDENASTEKDYSSYAKEELIALLEKTSDPDEIERIKRALLDQYRVELSKKHNEFTVDLKSATKKPSVIDRLLGRKSGN